MLDVLAFKCSKTEGLLKGFLFQDIKDPCSRVPVFVSRIRRPKALVSPQPHQHQQDGAWDNTGSQVRSLASSTVGPIILFSLLSQKIGFQLNRFGITVRLW